MAHGQPSIHEPLSVPQDPSALLGFDPRALPGFAPIPHVEDGLADLVRPGPQPMASPTAVFGGLPTAEVDAFAFDAADPRSAAARSTLPPAEGPSPPLSLTAGRPTHGAGAAPLGVDPVGGSSLPHHATRGTSVPNVRTDFEAPGAFGGLPTATGLRVDTFAQPVPGIDTSAFEKGASPYLAPTGIPGLAAASTFGPAGAGTMRHAPQLRGIDRPTPNAFEFTDAPHLGEFPEQDILRHTLDPRNGAPAVEGLTDRTTAPAHPYTEAGGLVPSAGPSFYFLDDRMDYFANDVPHVPRPRSIPFNAEAVRRDFPVLHQNVNGHPLVWLDNGATTQKPQTVIDRVAAFYANENSNISRSAHTLAANATNAYEDARATVQRFIKAASAEEVVFLRGTTEAINLVAQSYGRRFIKHGDEIVLTHGEHHANIVPWYNLARDVGATLKVAPFDDNGEIMLDEFEALLSDRVKIVATTHVANALGTVLPVKAMTDMAHRHGIPVLVDGAQSISHMPIDVQDIDCDFFVFSGHKVFAPTGIGALYGKKALLDQMPPWQGGGNMIKDVTFERITFQPPPGRFEAGTNNIADALGLAEALKYIERLGMVNIQAYEHALLDYATDKLAHIKGLKIIGRAKEKAGVISFLLEGKEPVEVGKALDQKGIAVRAGHHCALPILRRYGVEATVRPAFALYNTFEEADRLAEAVREIAAN